MEHTAVIFDTLQYAKRAEEAGFTKRQAEFQAEEIAKTINEQLATKIDLEMLKKDLIIKIGLMLFFGLTLLGTILGMLIACLK